MNRGLVISGLGHAGLILWVFLGDWFFLPSESPPVQVASVSLVSSSEYDAMTSAAPAAPLKAPDQPKPPATPEAAPAPPKPPVTKPAVKPAVKPLVEPSPTAADAAPSAPDAPKDAPIADAPQPDAAPPPVAPLAAQDQPIPVPNSDQAPAPKPIDRVEAAPVDPTRTAPDVADQATPLQSDQQTADAQPVVKQPDAAPLAAAPQVVTEATPTAPDAPQLAPTASKRPQSRPKAPQPADTQTASTDTATQDAVAAAVAAAAAATAPADPSPAATDTTSTAGGNGTAPTGPPMTTGEKDALRVAVSKCWSLGAVSTDAMQTIVTVQLSVGQDGVPDYPSIKMTTFSGGSQTSADQMFEVARRAIIRCGKTGFPLPPDKYDQWKDLELVFDPNGMRLR